MNFYNKIKEIIKDKKYIMYVDMDGVIAEYDFGKPCNFDKKRPLKTRINLLEQISKLDNIELRILSVCKKDFQIKEKNEWIDKNAPFFKTRIILSKEQNNIDSASLKANYLEDKIDTILLDDDNLVLKTVYDKNNKIICIQDSSLVD